MQIGMIGLGRMGSNMVRRLMREKGTRVWCTTAMPKPSRHFRAKVPSRWRILAAMRKQFGGHDEKKRES